MDDRNFNEEDMNKTSIFDENGNYIETSTSNKKELNVVKPIVERRDVADKTIDAVEGFIDTKDHKNVGVCKYYDEFKKDS